MQTPPFPARGIQDHDLAAVPTEDAAVVGGGRKVGRPGSRPDGHDRSPGDVEDQDRVGPGPYVEVPAERVSPQGGRRGGQKQGVERGERETVEHPQDRSLGKIETVAGGGECQGAHRNLVRKAENGGVLQEVNAQDPGVGGHGHEIAPAGDGHRAGRKRQVRLVFPGVVDAYGSSTRRIPHGDQAVPGGAPNAGGHRHQGIGPRFQAAVPDQTRHQVGPDHERNVDGVHGGEYRHRVDDPGAATRQVECEECRIGGVNEDLIVGRGVPDDLWRGQSPGREVPGHLVQTRQAV